MTDEKLTDPSTPRTQATPPTQANQPALNVWAVIKKHPINFTLVVIGVLLIALGIYIPATGNVWPDWTGFGNYTGNIPADARGKTLWDWLSLLIVPIILAVGGFWLNNSQSKKDHEIADQRNKNDALQAYIDKMTELLLDKGLRDPKPRDEVCIVAQTRTLATLRTLDGDRKGVLLNFLFEAGLINKDNAILKLKEADLSKADLSGAYLREANLVADAVLRTNILANLSGAYLHKADLSSAILDEAKLRKANLSEADLREALLDGADLSGANLQGAILDGARLDEANLQGAILDGAKLRGAFLHEADLSGANLRGAILDGADLSKSNLRLAIVTKDQWSKADSLEGATMPNGTKHT